MKFSYIPLLMFNIAIFVHSTDTFDDDGLTFQENENNIVNNATNVEGNFFDVAMVETNE